MIHLFGEGNRTASARIAALLESRWLLAAAGVAIVALGAALALWLQPQPHSDWGYYWDAAGKPEWYQRGGLSLWLLAALKATGMSPWVAASVLNAVAVAVLLLVMHASDTTKGHLLTWLVAAYLFLIAPFIGIVQLDMIAAAQLALGAWMVVSPPKSWPRAASLGVAIALFAMGVSTKPQYALIAWGMTGLFAIAWLLLRRRSNPSALLLMAVLFAGSVAGFAVDLGMRSFSGRTESIRTSSAVTLYGGLLVSSDGKGCGYWKPEATEAAISDLGRPLHEAVVDRLRDKPATHWLSIMECKLPQIVSPPSYALYWLMESPNVRAEREAHPARANIELQYRRVAFVEYRVYALIAWAILLATIIVAVHLWRRGEPLVALFGVLWMLAFWGVHLVFEIQGRYFLGMFLLLPLWCALMLRTQRGR
ncbi:hypothetical protein LK996_01515 [Lysobacter sp. A6]|uniref:Glycosyltransferase RgtA/B/C/D-like domain-containing protein n=1 Tax=Noviluteimonas lactosilytica TaxID=2888523 RepID=A0ABS8JDR8_9GAMM|nr:hypothetical protein [Lysobacter lactosilyticus]MCC8361760.1 hypothetical protein [Lysobacter lactosilyticus]